MAGGESPDQRLIERRPDRTHFKRTALGRSVSFHVGPITHLPGAERSLPQQLIHGPDERIYLLPTGRTREDGPRLWFDPQRGLAEPAEFLVQPCAPEPSSVPLRSNGFTALRRARTALLDEPRRVACANKQLRVLVEDPCRHGG